MHHHGAGEIMKFGAGERLDPGLHAKMVVPDNALKKWVDKADDDGCCNQLGIKARTFCDTTRDNGRNGRRKRQQKEEPDEFVAVFNGQFLGSDKEVGAISHAVTPVSYTHL